MNKSAYVLKLESEVGRADRRREFAAENNSDELYLRSRAAGIVPAVRLIRNCVEVRGRIKLRG